MVFPLKPPFSYGETHLLKRHSFPALSPSPQVRPSALGPPVEARGFDDQRIASVNDAGKYIYIYIYYYIYVSWDIYIYKIHHGVYIYTIIMVGYPCIYIYYTYIYNNEVN